MEHKITLSERGFINMAAMEKNLTRDLVPSLLDHALLKPEMPRKEVEEGVEVARKFRVASVCVRPFDVLYCRELLTGSGVKISAVVGFPHGNSRMETKVEEGKRAVEEGASELDVVLPLGLIKSGEYPQVEEEIRALAELARDRQVGLKLILENYYLTREEIVEVCRRSGVEGVSHLKTSTGFAPEGAREEDVRLMRDYAPRGIYLKAAGGIRTLEDLLRFYRAGATRIGTSSTEAIMQEAAEKLES